ncbi:MAG: hypothetical protein J0G35_03120, partial [Acidobacteriales bacterium]|nr:hypothetical protein [Terriglobales bacterium]
MLSREIVIRGLLIGGAAMLLASAFASAQIPSPSLHFHDIGPEAGLTTVPHSAPVKQYLVEMMGGGVGLFDCDNDG